MPSWNPPDGDDDGLACIPEFKVSGQPGVVGFALVGQTVTINAAHVKLVNTGQLCKDSFHALGPGDFQWVFHLPPGGNSVVTDSDTLQTQITLNDGGQYRVELTACPSGCTVITGDVGAADLEATVDPQPEKVVEFATDPKLRPQTLPELPASARDGVPSTLMMKEERDEKCLFGGGAIDPQWVTIENFAGPGDYAGGDLAAGEVSAVEGVVYKSKVSRKDSPLNHSHQDHNFAIKTDPAHNFTRLSGIGSQQFLDVEWEEFYLDPSYVPGNGDRASVFGYWILDCGHDPFASEIHPPIGLAVHRPRAIRIPDTETFDELGGSGVGSDVYVPGILTEVHFNAVAGKMMTCVGTGLHQPGTLVPQPGSQTLLQVTGDCISDPSPVAGFVYSFNIYLPKSPKASLEAAGVTNLPDIPLYVAYINDGTNPPPVQITRVTENDVAYLHVEVDFRGRSDPINRITFKIASAWVYPSEDNWGLRRWRVAVDTIDVHSDSDGAIRGKGEWNMWFHTNNASPETRFRETHHEWTKIIEREISDHIFETGPGGQQVVVGPPVTIDFDGRPWSTGDEVAEDRSLGPDLMLYPFQTIQVHTSGYEKDSYSQDSVGLINDLRIQQIASVSTRNVCKKSTDIDSLIYSGCTDYVLNYRIIDRGFAPGAALSPAAQAMMDAYTFEGDGEGCPDGDDVCAGETVVGDLPAPEQEEPWHPDFTVVALDDPPKPIYDVGLFRPQGIEKFGLVEIGVGAFHDLIVERSETDPEAVDDMLRQLREETDALLVSVGPEVLADVQVLCSSLPSNLCREYFGDLGLPDPPDDATRRKMTGFAKLSDKAGKPSINVLLHCYPLRRPNKLDVRWLDYREFEEHVGKAYKHHFRWPVVRRFKMGVMTTAACGDETEPMRAHEGWALGTLDGVPGAVANWTFEDKGTFGHKDHVRLVVYDPEREIVLDVEGRLGAGNLVAHDHKFGRH